MFEARGEDSAGFRVLLSQRINGSYCTHYPLRDVINKLAGIHFTASDELHTLAAHPINPPTRTWPASPS
jgi:hypothetical protein